MRTRGMLLAVAGVLAGSLVACGGGNGGGAGPGGANPDLVGRWSIFQRSTDGGKTWKKTNDEFEFIFRSNGSWIDSKDSRGNWWTRGSFLTATTTSSTTAGDTGKVEYWAYSITQNDTQLVIIEAEADGSLRQDGSLYVRLE